MSQSFSTKLRLFLAVFVLSLPLAACGEGWEMIRTTEMVPYGNTRTAGTGIAYVRAKLLPKKDLVLQPAERVQVQRRPDLIKANDMFEKSLIK